MKVVLSTVGRFHMFALARELHDRGMLTRIYSGFPWSALARERVPRELVGTFPLVRPLLMAAGRLPFRPPRAVLDLIHQASVTSLDAYVGAVLPDCDIYVAHEAVGLWSGARAKRRGIRYVCDRGCTHMGWREQILEEEYDRVGMAYPGLPRTYQREIDEYAIADLIVVPSDFARRSFVESGIPAERLAVIPYGVDLRRFTPDPDVRPRRDGFDLLFVGALSVRKGAHDLFRAFDALSTPNKRLTIAGLIAPDIRAALQAQFARDDVEVLGPVPQAKLRELMSRSHALVLPSIEEGLALVQAEALACGCPIVSTRNTGAEDLITDGVEGFIVPIRSPEQMAERLQRLADNPELRDEMSQRAIARTQMMGGWREYGEASVAAYRQLLDTGRRESPAPAGVGHAMQR